MKVKKSKWRWFGCAGHFIGADKCQWHLHTRIGDYRISSVGAYAPDSYNAPTKERPFKEIGLGRTFETMVFKVSDQDAKGSCPGEGSVIEWSEVDSDGYNSFEEATKGHLAMCEKWAVLVPENGASE